MRLVDFFEAVDLKGLELDDMEEACEGEEVSTTIQRYHRWPQVGVPEPK